ncbi:MAG: hypothetical protein ACTHKC_10055 [Candidatus Nitrosocosmicus sp.]
MKPIQKDAGVHYSLGTTESIIDPELKDQSYGPDDFVNYLSNRFNISW